jgi:hypothetical protein
VIIDVQVITSIPESLMLAVINQERPLEKPGYQQV